MKASCHCGTVQFEVDLVDGLNTARRCNCSYCRMRGAVAISVKLDGLRILTGEDKLASYRFNTGTAQHFFCSVCGIYTHHQRRSKPDEYGANAACLEGVSPFDFAEVRVMDGQNHVADTGTARVAGLLRYIGGNPMLTAAANLHAVVDPWKVEPGTIEELAQAIDCFMIESWVLLGEDVASIESTDDEPPRSHDSEELRTAIAKRFPDLGLHWRTLGSRMSTNQSGEIGTADAINDILDIWTELSEVFWFQQHHGDSEAMAALRFRYHHHLFMHLLPLRLYLEDLMFDA